MNQPPAHPREESISQRPESLAALVLLAGGVIVYGFFFSARQSDTELNVYTIAARRMLEGEPIYRLDAPAEERIFSYPPLSGLVFVPLALLPEALHRPLWYLINVAALAIIFTRIHRRITPLLQGWKSRWLNGRQPTFLFWGIALAVCGRHLFSPLENQSHDLVLFLTVMLAVDAWCGGQALLTGFWAGVGTALKAIPLLFAPFLLWHRQWKACAAFVLTTAGLTLLPDLLVPAKDGQSWAVTWQQVFLKGAGPGQSAALAHTWWPWTPLNQSVAGTVHRLVSPIPAGNPGHEVSFLDLGPAPRRFVILLAQLAVAGWFVWVTRPSLTRSVPPAQLPFHRLGEGAALATAMVLLSPTSIKTFFCVLILPVSFCLTDFLCRRRDPFVGLALVVSFMLGTLTVRGLVGIELGNQVLSFGSITFLTLLLLLATGRILLARARACRLTSAYHPSVEGATLADAQARAA